MKKRFGLPKQKFAQSMTERSLPVRHAAPATQKKQTQWNGKGLQKMKWFLAILALLLLFLYKFRSKLTVLPVAAAASRPPNVNAGFTDVGTSATPCCGASQLTSVSKGVSPQPAQTPISSTGIRMLPATIAQSGLVLAKEQPITAPKPVVTPAPTRFLWSQQIVAANRNPAYTGLAATRIIRPSVL